MGTGGERGGEGRGRGEEGEGRGWKGREGREWTPRKNPGYGPEQAVKCFEINKN